MRQFAVGAAVFVAIVLVARLLRGVVSRIMSGRKVQPELVILVRESLYAALIVVAVFLFVTTTLGLPLLAFGGFLGAAVLAGLGIQDILKNYVSGFYILIERNIRVGDTIQVDGNSGIVTDVRMRVTYLRSDDGGLVIIPNSTLFNNSVLRKGAEGPPEARS